ALTHPRESAPPRAKTPLQISPAPWGPGSGTLSEQAQPRSGDNLLSPRRHQESESGPTPRFLFPYQTSPGSPHPAWSRERADGLRGTDACDIADRTGILTLTGAGPSKEEVVRDR